MRPVAWHQLRLSAKVDIQPSRIWSISFSLEQTLQRELFDSDAAAILGCNLSAYHHHQLITHVLIQASAILIPLYFIKNQQEFRMPSENCDYSYRY